jgi:serine protease SohB
VDDIRTSDECILQACDLAEVFEVEYEVRKSIQDKLGNVLENSLEKVLSSFFTQSRNDIYQ